MKSIINWIAFVFLAIFFFSCKKEPSKPYVIMLSMDAFRWDYPEIYHTPNLDSIAKLGVKAKALIPCFPSKTFPNHYSMATGLYPDHHGIVQNSFYDKKLGLSYRISDRKAVENPVFYGGEPIWATAKKQGIKSASYFWVGSETTSKEMNPTYWKKYDHYFPFEQRIDSVIAWLQLPEEKRPQLIMWYMHEPDAIGHDFGPYAQETGNMIKHLDSLVGVFTKKINKLSIAKDINLIFTADHGMGPISNDRKVILKSLIPEDWVEIVKGSNPVYLLDIKQEFEDSVDSILKSTNHISAWKTNEVPERFHYGSNPRTMDFVIAADSAWSIYWDKPKYKGSGTHGYDNMNTDMHAIFYGIGPAFKTNHSHPAFYNIDLYNLISKILGLKPAKNDGDYNRVKDMLKK